MDSSWNFSEFFTEPVLVGILATGIAVVVIAYYWLTVRAVAASKWWRVGYVPPISVLYLLSGSGRVLAPLWLMIVGGAVAATPYLLTHYVQPLMPKSPWVKTVDGQTHATLTGLKDFDYSLLRSRKDIVVLQMANEDVNDATLENLRGLEAIQELDLNFTGITDAGLGVLRDLPLLKTLRIKNTGISDSGFRDTLSQINTLMEVDATGTQIKSATLRSWKSAKEGRKFLK
jgi:hypothetical protein